MQGALKTSPYTNVGPLTGPVQIKQAARLRICKADMGPSRCTVQAVRLVRLYSPPAKSSALMVMVCCCRSDRPLHAEYAMLLMLVQLCWLVRRCLRGASSWSSVLVTGPLVITAQLHSGNMAVICMKGWPELAYRWSCASPKSELLWVTSLATCGWDLACWASLFWTSVRTGCVLAIPFLSLRLKPNFFLLRFVFLTASICSLRVLIVDATCLASYDGR